MEKKTEWEKFCLKGKERKTYALKKIDFCVALIPVVINDKAQEISSESSFKFNLEKKKLTYILQPIFRRRPVPFITVLC